MDKLDKWVEDVKEGMEIQLQQLTQDIKYQKTESRKILKLEDKLNTQRNIKELEKKRNKMRMSLYEMQDEVDEKKENLIDELEKRLKQKINEETLFSVKWKLF